MKNENLSRATLGRLPVYLRYLRSQDDEYVSAAEMARALNLGEVMVRKDIRRVCSQGRPKIGYPRRELVDIIENILGIREPAGVVVAGAGKLGKALMLYRGFKDFGLSIVAGFDADPSKLSKREACPVLPVEEMAGYCRENSVKVGVIAVPERAAQSVCDSMIEGGITTIWNFAPYTLKIPKGVSVRNENLVLSLAHLCLGGGKGNGCE